jgi:hypothetical protein
MNDNTINPFNELYVTETVPSQDFVRLFSPVLIKDALPLFQPGNVVVKGVQGSGKSMLLNLLKPEIRIAYAKAGMDLPLPRKLSRFIGAGINFIRSAAIDFGQRATDPDQATDIQRLPLYFGDFFNYWILADLLKSVETLYREFGGEGPNNLGIQADPSTLDDFARKLVTDPCWLGYLSPAVDYKSLRGRIEERIGTYRRFLNFSLDALPVEIKRTTTPVGEPISHFTECLRQCGIVPREVPIFIRIDQYEELCRLEDWSKDLGLKYRRVINKALGLRDPRVSYRASSGMFRQFFIGPTGPFWPDSPSLLTK